MSQAAQLIRRISRNKIIAYLLLCFPVALLFTGATMTQENKRPDSRFGVAEAFWAPNEAIELGVGWERILFYWKEIQPSGPDDWNTLHVREEWLVDAESNGREVVGLLKNTAVWASADGTEAGLPLGLELPIDDPNNYWANFTRRIAEYYAPRNVHNWIIWNEPEITAETYGYEFAGDVEDYYLLLKVAYKVIKDVDPEASIHLAGVTWWHDQTFLRRLFEVAAADPEAPENDWFFDVISLHIYFRPDTVLSIVHEVQALQDEFGLEKRIWLNETNAPPNRDPLWPVDRPAFQVDLEQQAWFIIQATALALSEGTERVAVYKLADVMLPEGGESFGLLRQDSSRRPAFNAYATMIDHLGNFSEVSLKQHPHYYVVTYTWPNKVTRIAWSRIAQSVVLRMPSLSDSATIVNYLGDSADLAPDDGAYYIALPPAVCHEDCLIGGAPIFIVEDDFREDIQLIETAIAVAGIQPAPVEYVAATPYPTITASSAASSAATSAATSTAAPSSTPTVRASETPDEPTPPPTLTIEEPTSVLTSVPTVELTSDSGLTSQDSTQVATPEPSPLDSEQEGNVTVPEGQANYSGLIFLALACLLLVLLVVFSTRYRRERK
jgi:hypothetical protein